MLWVGSLNISKTDKPHMKQLRIRIEFHLILLNSVHSWCIPVHLGAFYYPNPQCPDLRNAMECTRNSTECIRNALNSTEFNGIHRMICFSCLADDTALLVRRFRGCSLAIQLCRSIEVSMEPLVHAVFPFLQAPA